MWYCPIHMKISWESQKEFGHLFENCKKNYQYWGSQSHTPSLHLWQWHVVRRSLHFSISNFTAIKQTRLIALCPGLPRSASTRKVKPIWILLKQDTVSGSGISWAIWKSAICSRHNNASTPTTQFCTGQMPFLPPNQQHQSTEGTAISTTNNLKIAMNDKYHSMCWKCCFWNFSSQHHQTWNGNT